MSDGIMSTFHANVVLTLGEGYSCSRAAKYGVMVCEPLSRILTFELPALADL